MVLEKVGANEFNACDSSTRVVEGLVPHHTSRKTLKIIWLGTWLANVHKKNDTGDGRDTCQVGAEAFQSDCKVQIPELYVLFKKWN
jgi:hypothetical protein